MGQAASLPSWMHPHVVAGAAAFNQNATGEETIATIWTESQTPASPLRR